ncbi:MAG: hypothetical protein C5B51_26080 [Terriglobia bacterium]|nr:MAG: hypothetical protein C5B51_26080 [Terriglobia bacterium]
MPIHYILLGSFACAVTCLGAGLLAVRVSHIVLTKLECICLGYSLGCAIVSTVTLGIALLSIARKGIFLGIALVTMVIVWRLLPWFQNLETTRLRTIPIVFQLLFLGTWIVYGILYFKHALAPEMSPDAVTYHLGFVNLWNHAHGMSRVIDMYAAMPQGMEMLFLFAFSIGRHSAASLVHFSFLMLLPMLMVLYGIRFGFRHGAAVLAGIIVFVTPLVGWDGSVAYNDVALAAVVFAAIYFLQIWRYTGGTSYLLASSLLAGYCFTIKYTGLLAILFVAAAIGWQSRRKTDRVKVGTLAIVFVALALTPLPYLVRNWLWFQNPIAFFGNSAFPNPYFHISFESAYIQGQAHLNGVTWRDLPRELTLGATKLPDNLGPVYLLAPLALIGVFWRQSRFLLAAALAIGATYVAQKSARFLIPVLPLVMMAVAFVCSRLAHSGWIMALIAAAQAILSWPSMVERIRFVNIPGPSFTSTSWRVALRKEPEEQYLAQFDDYSMARLIESCIPEGQAIFALSGGAAQSYTTRFILDSYHSALAEKAADLFYSNESSPTDVRWRWRVLFPKTLAREVRISQTARKSAGWSIKEIELLQQGKALPLSQQWSRHAVPNPWDAGLAFDGSEATRWQSWEPLRPDMEIRVRLNTAQYVDGLEILSGNGPWETNMEPRLLDETGNWICPTATMWHADPPLDSRRAATQALKDQGIRYVLINANGWHGTNFRRDPDAWGLQEVFSTRESTLFRIE